MYVSWNSSIQISGYAYALSINMKSHGNHVALILMAIFEAIYKADGEKVAHVAPNYCFRRNLSIKRSKQG